MSSAEEQLTRNNPVTNEVIHIWVWLCRTLFCIITSEVCIPQKKEKKERKGPTGAAVKVEDRGSGRGSRLHSEATHGLPPDFASLVDLTPGSDKVISK